jgi:hypothetical protein
MAGVPLQELKPQRYALGFQFDCRTASLPRHGDVESVV